MSRRATGEVEFVTNWRLVTVLCGMTALPVIGIACWAVSMRSASKAAHMTGARRHVAAATRVAPIDTPSLSGPTDGFDSNPWTTSVGKRSRLGRWYGPTPGTVERGTLEVTETSQETSAAESIPYEWQVLDQLERESVELRLEPLPSSTSSNSDDPRTPERNGNRMAWLRDQGHLSGFELIGEDACRVSPEQASEMQQLSLTMARILSQTRVEEFESGSIYLDTARDLESVLNRSKIDERHISTLLQVLQVEFLDARMLLVQTLARIPGTEATAAIAQRAIFDTSHEVRREAVRQLERRPAPQVRRLLLAGLRYPWSVAAANAARALAALQDSDAIPALIDLLDRPDPLAPVRANDGQWYRPELVRVNHLRNCTVCHAPSTNRKDPVRGFIPVPGSRIPMQYYRQPVGDFVRADVTYLRQDFSMMHEVANAAPWPTWQRFDYFVRRLPLPPEQADRIRRERSLQGAVGYPQRESVLFALRELVGEDFGTDSADWRAGTSQASE